MPTCQTTEHCTGNGGVNDWTLNRKLWLWDALPYSPPQMRLRQWMFFIFIWSSVPGASFSCYTYLRWNILKSKSDQKTNIKFRSSKWNKGVPTHFVFPSMNLEPWSQFQIGQVVANSSPFGVTTTMQEGPITKQPKNATALNTAIIMISE